MTSCRSPSSRTCSSHIPLRWRCSRIRSDIRYSSCRPHLACSRNRLKLDRRWKFRPEFESSREGSTSMHRKIREAKRKDHRNGQEDTHRNVGQPCCGCTSSIRRRFCCNFRQRSGRCFRYSRKAGKVEPFQKLPLGHHNNRPSRSRNVDLNCRTI